MALENIRVGWYLGGADKAIKKTLPRATRIGMNARRHAVPTSTAAAAGVATGYSVGKKRNK